MARNAEEEYLDQLLHNAMMQDAKFEKDSSEEEELPIADTSDISDTYDATTEQSHEDILNEDEILSLNEIIKSVSEESAAADEVWDEEAAKNFGDESFAVLDEEDSLQMPVLEDDVIPDDVILDDILSDNYSKEMDVTEDSQEPDTSSDTDFIDNLKSIVANAYGKKDDESSDYIDESLGFVALPDENPEPFFDNPLATDEVGSYEEQLATDEGAPYEEPYMTDARTDNDSSEFDDILALDDGMGLDGEPKEAGEQYDTGDDLPGMSMDFGSIYGEEADNIEPNDKLSDTKKKKKTKKKQPKEKKKFSLKNFFLDYDEEEESSQNKDADLNQQLIDELYNNVNSLADAEIDKDDSKVKIKKEKVKKAKKEKVRKPKEKKEKPEKEATPANRVSGGRVFMMILIGASLGAFIIVFSNVFSYNRVIKAADRYFTAGNYGMAYEEISGVTPKAKDNDLYMKIRTVMLVYQGIESYNTYISAGDTELALDALITAAANKHKADADAVKYEVTDEVLQMYDRVLSLLDRYGIDETKALELYSMTNYEEYRKTLKGYGGIIIDSGN